MNFANLNAILAIAVQYNKPPKSPQFNTSVERNNCSVCCVVSVVSLRVICVCLWVWSWHPRYRAVNVSVTKNLYISSILSRPMCSSDFHSFCYDLMTFLCMYVHILYLSRFFFWKEHKSFQILWYFLYMYIIDLIFPYLILFFLSSTIKLNIFCRM